MRFIMRSSLSIILLILISIPLFAQLPDPLNPLFHPEVQVLRADEAKDHHVRSCTTYKDGKFFREVIYDGQGYVLKNAQDYYYRLYNEFGNCKNNFKFYYDTHNGSTNYLYDDNGKLIEIRDIFSSSAFSSENIITFKYEDDRVVQINRSYKSKYNQDLSQYSKTVTSDFYYDQNNLLKEVKAFTYEVTYLLGLANESKSYSKNLFYENERLISSLDDGKKYKYYYNESKQLLYINEINDDTKSIVEISIESFDYYSNGLIKSREHVDDGLFEYKYDYMEPANFNLFVPVSISQISLYNYPRNADYQTLPVKSGVLKTKIYIPDTEIYLVQITPNFVLPLILTPGKTVNMSVDETSTSYGDKDTLNNMLLNLETVKMQAYQLYDQEQAVKVFAELLVEQLPLHPDFPGFLVYTEYWDIQNNKQLFLNYTRRMSEIYPLNFKARESYSLINQ